MQKKKDLLTSWKEISTYLDCDVRTCIRYEKEYNLPIIRLGKIKRTRVHALKKDLDEWLESFLSKKISKSSTHKKFVKSRRLFVFLVLSVLVTAAIFVSLKKDKSLLFNRAEFNDGYLRFYDQKDNLIKTQNFNNTYNAEYTHILNISDINGDNKQELLFVYTPQKTHLQSSRLMCFDSSGEIIWEYEPGREMKTSKKLFNNIYIVKIAEVFEPFGDGRKFLLVGASHSPWEPYQLTLLNVSGDKVSEYWNCGHIALGAIQIYDIDKDGVKEILIGGHNNGYRKGFLAVLDPRLIQGASPQDYAPDSQFIDIKKGTQEYYLLFPNSTLNKLFNAKAWVKRINIIEEEQKIEVVTCEYCDSRRDYNFRYSFDLSLNVIDVKPEDYYLEKLDELSFLKGIKKPNIVNIKNLRTQIEYWSGIQWLKKCTGNPILNSVPSVSTEIDF